MLFRSPTPCAEPMATSVNENTKAFQISPGWPCQQVTHYTFSSSFPGVRGPLRLVSHSLDDRFRRISFRSRLIAAAGLGLPRSDPASSLLRARVSGALVFSWPGSSPSESRNPWLGPGENVGRPERQVILQIPFPEERVESLVRFVRKEMKKRK